MPGRTGDAMAKGEERPAGAQPGRAEAPWAGEGNHVRVERRDLPGDAAGQRLFAVWHRLRDKAGGIPMWLDMDALGVPEAVPGAILVIPEPQRCGSGPQRFIAAFVGKEVQRVWGEDFTGQVMYSDVFPEMYEAMACGMRASLAQGVPLAAEYRVQIAFRISYLYAAFLPFAAAAEGQSRVLVHLNFSNINIRDAQDWRSTLETQARIRRLLDGRPGD